ncbi:hypothetical protein DPEC_G00168370 [Dallia pectoralis]|uniref:Uncharacterized protein n=1 Tax=Dallia pectoralis TaxID=75939 RepID=A0ACC2GCT7_DALPE|nr:hypothetical protein DPEC_G00168370 [Dallia pectoralis]
MLLCVLRSSVRNGRSIAHYIRYAQTQPLSTLRSRNPVYRVSRRGFTESVAVKSVSSRRTRCAPETPASSHPGSVSGMGGEDCGSLSADFSSRRVFRKTSPELHEMMFREDGMEENDLEEFKSRTGRRNTPYWYFLQCKRLIKENKLLEALSMFQCEMLKGERLRPEEFNYTVLIGGCGRAGKLKQAFKLYNDMKKRGLAPSDATYTALFNACAESPWKQAGLYQAIQLEQELQRKNHPLSDITYHALLKTHALNNHLRACLHTLRDMLQAGHAVTQETFHYLLMGCVKDRDTGFRQALQVYRQMVRLGIRPDLQNYNLLLRAARDCGIGDTAVASALLLTSDPSPGGQGLKVRGQGSVPLDVDALESQLFTQLSDNDTANLSNVLGHHGNGSSIPLIKKPSHRNMECSAVVPVTTQPVMLGIKGELEASIGSHPCLPTAKARPPNLLDLVVDRASEQCVISLGTVSGPSDRLALMGGAQGFLDKMAVNGLSPDIRTLTLLADTIEPGSQSIQYLLAVAKQKGVKLDTAFYNSVICRAARAGSLQDARAVISMMKDRRVRVEVQTYGSLALSCNRQTDGLQLLSDMQADQLQPNVHVFSALIGCAARRLDYVYLRAVLKAMTEHNVPVNDIIITQLEHACQYPPNYNQYKSRNTYLSQIDGFRVWKNPARKDRVFRYCGSDEMDTDVIILSDSDEDLPQMNDSVYMVEDVKKQVLCKQLNISQPIGEDEDLVVTFSQRAEVLPHARYDCSIYMFTPSDSCVGAPLETNDLFCSQCFCYVCDKLVSECSVWNLPGQCHCNAHKKSVFWTSKRDKVVLGYLQTFKFNLLEIDSDLRLAEFLLVKFEEELSSEYASFLIGHTSSLLANHCACHCHTANRVNCRTCHSNHLLLQIYDYTRVFGCVSRFLDQADREKPRTASVMRLGSAKMFITHHQPPGRVLSHCPEARISEAIPSLLNRVTEAVRKQMVECNFSLEFLQKLQSFFRTLPLPPSCIEMRNRLCVLPWSDVLLVSVLKGQNVTGIRLFKGKKEQLTESPAVILLRAEILQKQNRYRELARYLKVVQTYNTNHVKLLLDLIPLFLMKVGDFRSALSSFFSPPPDVCCPACRITPAFFSLYLRILTTATAPSTTTALSPETPWEEVKGALLPKLVDVVKFGLRILKSSKTVYMDDQSWACFIKIIPPCVGPTDVAFLEVASDVTKKILLNQGSLGQNIQIPRSFVTVFPEQALLLLITQALALRIIDQPLTQTLHITYAYKDRFWAWQWLIKSISSSDISPLKDLGEELTSTGS